jgi:membrane-bound lytic murein transglycosylase MltF
MVARPRTSSSRHPSPFEPLFAEHAGDLPVALLCALAFHESSFNPRDVNPAGAYGLFQITRPALDGYNARHATNHEPADLLDPELNTTIAVDHLQRILATYAQHPALQTDWASRRFVELLVFGWNAGHNGVARIVARMEASGLSPDRITIDTVTQLAAPGTHLASPKNVGYAKAVTRTYFGETVTGGGGGAAGGEGPVASGRGIGTFLLGVGILGLTIAVAPRGR